MQYVELTDEVTDDVEVRVFRMLTTTPDKWVSLQKLYNDYMNGKHYDISSKDFVLTCLYIPSSYDNIYVEKKDGIFFLSFLTGISRNETKVEAKLDMPTHSQFGEISDSELVDYIYGDKFVEYEKYLEVFGESPLHVLCRESKYDSIQKIITRYSVNTNDAINLKNNEGKTPIDLLDFKKYPHESAMIIKLLYKTEINNLKKKSDTTINGLQDDIYQLSREISELTRENRTPNYIKSILVNTVAIIALFYYMYYVH